MGTGGRRSPGSIAERGRHLQLAAGIFSSNARSRWLLKPVGVNRQPAFAVYQRGETGSHHLFGIQILSIDRDQIAKVVTFIDPKLFRYFKLPEEIAG